jgi:HD-GYP domain-containing protein (c-di-GMP phosphodiesterase class II)
MGAEELVGQARARRARSMDSRERAAVLISAGLYLAAAGTIAALLPSARDVDPLLTVGLLLGYAAASRVRFEFGGYYVVPEQLLLVPMLLLAPLPMVPLLVAAAGALGMLPDLVRGSWGRDRWLTPVADSWPVIPPVLIIAALAPGSPSLALSAAYMLALGGQLAADFIQTVIREGIVDRVGFRTFAGDFAGTARVDVVLSPVAFVASLAADDEPLVLPVVVCTLVWVLENFARDRRERYAAALELHRAYRGTVMLLSDVLEFEDEYTADHSRSVVDLVNEVARELGFDERGLQELEFAAMLHDIGKIAIPKEILHKPAALTDEEFAVMKTHTIEGQLMLDRVGGLLGRVGQTVRWCHERWDGKGYPDGLAGEQIPLAARIVFACDAYNAMTTDRPYRAAKSREEALDELAANSGTQFDPRVVAALAKVVTEGEPISTTSAEVRALLASRPVPERTTVAS